MDLTRSKDTQNLRDLRDTSAQLEQERLDQNQLEYLSELIKGPIDSIMPQRERLQLRGMILDQFGKARDTKHRRYNKSRQRIHAQAVPPATSDSPGIVGDWAGGMDALARKWVQQRQSAPFDDWNLGLE